MCFIIYNLSSYYSEGLCYSFIYIRCNVWLCMRLNVCVWCWSQVGGGGHTLGGWSIVHQCDGLGEETVFVSGCFCIESSITPARGEKFKQLMCRVWRVCRDVNGPFPDSGWVQVLDGGQFNTNDSLCSPDCPCQSVLVLFGGWSKPDDDGGAENRLNYCRVELEQQLLGQVKNG